MINLCLSRLPCKFCPALSEQIIVIDCPLINHPLFMIKLVGFVFQIYESKKPLRIGFYVHDGYIQPVPACQRAVLMAKAALESRGHTVCYVGQLLLMYLP